MEDEKKGLEEQEVFETASKGKKQSLFSRLRNRRAERNVARREKIEKGLSAEENQKVEEKIEEVNKEIEESHTSTTRKKVWKSLFFILNIVLVVGVLIWDVFTS